MNEICAQLNFLEVWKINLSVFPIGWTIYWTHCFFTAFLYFSFLSLHILIYLLYGQITTHYNKFLQTVSLWGDQFCKHMIKSVVNMNMRIINSTNRTQFFCFFFTSYGSISSWKAMLLQKLLPFRETVAEAVETTSDEEVRKLWFLSGDQGGRDLRLWNHSHAGNGEW